MFLSLTIVPVSDPANFPAGSYWKTLQPTVEAEDQITASGGPRFYDPTEDPEMRDLQPKKRQFDNAFDRLVFVGTAKVPILT